LSVVDEECILCVPRQSLGTRTSDTLSALSVLFSLKLRAEMPIDGHPSAFGSIDARKGGISRPGSEGSLPEQFAPNFAACAEQRGASTQPRSGARMCLRLSGVLAEIISR
jgi:hypothetical protein